MARSSFFRQASVLGSTPLRRHALQIMQAGLESINTQEAVRRTVGLARHLLRIGEQVYDLRHYRRVFVIGIGKASLEAGKALESILGDRITEGIILDVKRGALKHMKSLAGTHPFPSETNIRATAEIIGLAKSVDSRDLLITIVSGGGSALLCWPYQLGCDDMVNMTRVLMKKGATIHEINTVRKHTSEIQGGQLARLAHPATVAGLIFSDVPGDELSMIASGPTFLDTTTAQDAKRILEKYHVLSACRLPQCGLIETPKDPLFFAHVTNTLVVGNSVATEAMMKKARALGYDPVLYSNALEGEAREMGALFAQLVQPGQALIAGGETTVQVKGKGMGGRNQEFALGALTHLSENALVLSCASDGIDHSPAAGAFVDEGVVTQAKRLRLSSAMALSKNDSYPFFQKTKSALVTGITGMNVSDLMLALRSDS